MSRRTYVTLAHTERQGSQVRREIFEYDAPTRIVEVDLRHGHVEAASAVFMHAMASIDVIALVVVGECIEHAHLWFCDALKRGSRLLQALRALGGFV